MHNADRRPQHIVRGQRVEESKVAAAKTLRHNMTPAETHLWNALRGGTLHGFRFRRQQIIQGFIADFYCHAAGLVVECDSVAHDAEYDTERDSVFASLGIRVLRFSNEEVLGNTRGVLDTIMRHLGARR